MNKSRWVKCISNQGNIRGVAIQAAPLVQEALGKHQLNDEAAKGLGEAIL